MELLGKKDFLKKYNIDADKFDQAGIIWDDLIATFNDYKTIVGDLEAIAQFSSHILNKSPRTHSTKYRVKSPEHLIEKIIRKTIEKNVEIKFADYREKITDMVGVRVLHLFKEDWREIDRFIKDKFDVIEGPRAHIKEGDDDSSFSQNNCTIVRHSRGYRSVHYLVRAGLSRRQFIAEIQVRTIFEEGWSEIDHELKYPYIKNNLILERLLSILNNFAASADEMGSFINYIRSEFSKGQQVADELVDKIDKLNIDNYEKSVIKEGVDRIGNLFLPELKNENAEKLKADIPEKYKEKPQMPPAPVVMADDELLPEGQIGYDYKEILEQRRLVEGQRGSDARNDFVSIIDILNHNKKAPPA